MPGRFVTVMRRTSLANDRTGMNTPLSTLGPPDLPSSSPSRWVRVSERGVAPSRVKSVVARPGASRKVHSPG